MDPLLDGVGEDHVVDHDVVGLADPVDPADALLDPHGVPGQVVVDGDMTELEVEAFAPASVEIMTWASVAKACWVLRRSSMSIEPLRQTTENPRAVRYSASICWVGTNSVKIEELEVGGRSLRRNGSG